MNQVQCPACKGAFQYGPETAGQLVQCPTCQTTLQLPNQIAGQLPGQLSGAANPNALNANVSHSPINQPKQQASGSYSTPQPNSTVTHQQKHHGFKKKGKPWLGTLIVWGGIGTAVAALIVAIVFYLNGGKNVDTSASVAKQNSDSALSNVRESKKLTEEGFRKLRDSNQSSHLEAFALFTDALKLDSKNADAHVGLGHARQHVKTKSKPAEILALRIEDYGNAIQLDRENAEAYAGRAECFLNQEKLNLALSDIQNAIKFGTGHRLYNDWKRLQIQIELEQRVGASRFDADKIFQ